MTRFTVSDTLFGDSSIFYMDPVSGKQKEMFCNPDSVEGFKTLILKNLIRSISSHLYFNRSKVFDFLEKSNPHHVTPAFRKAISRLRVSIAKMYGHDDIKELASHVSIQIIPDLFSESVAPSKAKPDAERYNYLVNELENLTHEILNSDIQKLTAETGTVKTAQMAF